MNKKLLERVNNILGETPQIITAETIIRMCADEAAEAIKQCPQGLFISEYVAAIEERMK